MMRENSKYRNKVREKERDNRVIEADEVAGSVLGGGGYILPFLYGSGQGATSTSQGLPN